jgi:glutamyl-tRNA synthetase
MNGEYIKRLPKDVFRKTLVDSVEAAGLDAGGVDLDYLVDQLQVRTKFLGDMPENCRYFFTEDYAFEEKAVTSRLKVDGMPELLKTLAQKFEDAPDFSVEPLEAMIKAYGEERGDKGMGPLVHPIRVAVSGGMTGIGLFEMLVALGRERTVQRLRTVADRLMNGSL